MNAYSYNSYATLMAHYNTIYTIILILGIVLAIWNLVIMWRLFVRAGQEGWKALIPVYRIWVLMRDVLGWGVGSVIVYFICLFAMGLVFLYYIDIHYHLAKRFDKGIGFRLGAAILWPIFGGILAFEKTEETLNNNFGIPEQNTHSTGLIQSAQSPQQDIQQGYPSVHDRNQEQIIQPSEPPIQQVPQPTQQPPIQPQNPTN